MLQNKSFFKIISNKFNPSLNFKPPAVMSVQPHGPRPPVAHPLSTRVYMRSLVPRLWSFHSEAVTLKSHALHFSYKAWDDLRQKRVPLSHRVVVAVLRKFAPRFRLN